MLSLACMVLLVINGHCACIRSLGMDGQCACMDEVTCTRRLAGVQGCMACKVAFMRKHAVPITQPLQPTRKMMAAKDVCSGSAIVQSTSPANMARACRHHRRGWV